MRNKLLLTALSMAAMMNIACAQEYNPYKSIGKKGKVLTAYGGRFNEFFDYDSIQRIGSVMFNIRTKKIVRLLNPDATFKKASDNSSSSRWYCIDPKADKYYSYSPYNFVLNNPIRLTDPDGTSVNDDDYISKAGKYLGSDGATTNNQRIISAQSYYDIETKNGGTTSSAATSELQAKSKIVTVNIPGGKTEGEYFKAQFDAGNGDGQNKNTYKEMNTSLLLNPETATLTVLTNPSSLNGPQSSVALLPSEIPGVKNGSLILLGDAHTHQIADLPGFNDERNRDISNQKGDNRAVRATGRLLFTIDSQNVDALVPQKGIMGITASPRDNVSTTQNLYNNNFSILRTALDLFGGKK